MKRMASVAALFLILLLTGPGLSWAAHTHAHVSLSDGHTAVSDSDDDWGVTCSSQANQVHGSASAASGASVTWNTGYPFYNCKTASTWDSFSNTPGYQSSHSPTYAHPYDFNIRLYGEGTVADCSLWLESIELVVPVGPSNMSLVGIDIYVDGAWLGEGHFMLFGDGYYEGDGWYIDSFFDVFFDGDNWHGVYDGPPEVSVELPVGTPLQFDITVSSDSQINMPAAASRGSTTHTVTFGIPEEYTVTESKVGASMSCIPPAGIVPFNFNLSFSLDNFNPEQYRRLAGRLNLSLANGNWYPNWRAGWTNLGPGEGYHTSWSQNIPAVGAVIGDNIFDLVVEDVTPAPYNLPPYPPAGGTAAASCIVNAQAP